MPRRNNRRLRRFRLYALALHPYCQWCGTGLTGASATADHLIPRSQGGSDDWANLLLACAVCNLDRGDRAPTATPLGPRWNKSLALAAGWVAWTRYPHGRWRRTLRGPDPVRLEADVRRVWGSTVEIITLAEGAAP